MGRTREIKKRMTAVKTIQRITKTMQMIATAKFTSALQRAKATRPYADRIRQLVGEVSASGGDVSHPLIDGPSEPAGRELILVITSDRGLCGAYNGNVLRHAVKHLRRLKKFGTEATLHTSGKKAVGYFRFQKIDIDERFQFGDKPDYDEVEALAQRYIKAFESGEYDAIRVAYMKFESSSRQTPDMLQLLPLKPESIEGEAAESSGPTVDYEFSPSREGLLDSLLPMTVKTSLFQAFNDAVVSEHIQRMVAMKAATDNAKSLGDTLRRDFNRARQSQITTELMEVISGAAS